MGTHLEAAKTPMDGQINAHQHVEDVPLDFVDPHRAALESNPEHSEIPSLSTLLAVVSLALAYICPISCGFSLATGILISIGTALGDTTNITWLVGGWSIASSVSFSMAGGLSDVFGRRWTIISGQIFCIIGSIVAATAKNVSTIIVASTFLGFGCGIIFVSYAGISELLPNKWRATGLALTELAINIPFNIANVIIATELNLHTALAWRWCYWIGLMFAVTTIRSRENSLGGSQAIGRDRYCPYTAGLTTFLIGLTWAGQTNHPWRSVSVIAPIVIGFCVLAACFAYDFTLAKRPLFPLEVFRKVRDFTVLLGIVFVAGKCRMIYFSMSALLPQGSLYIFTSDPIQIGLIALPNGIVRFIFGAVATSFMGKIKHLKVQILVGLGIQAIFTACLAAIIPQNKIAWSALQAFAVGPFALVVLACYVIARLNVPLRYLGLASGLIGTFRSMGGSVGNAIFNAVLQGVTSKDLGPAIASAAIGQGFNATELGLLIPATVEAVVGVPDAFAGVPGATQAVQTAAILAFRQVYARAFQMVFFSTIPFGVMAVILACFIRDPSIYLTNHTAIHMERDGVFNKGAVQGHHDGHMLGKAEADADNKVVHAGKS